MTQPRRQPPSGPRAGRDPPGEPGRRAGRNPPRRPGARVGDALPPGLEPPDAVGEPVEAVTLSHNATNAATGGIWRVRGRAGTAVLKVARPPADPPLGSPGWPTSDTPTHFNYWRREALAYTSGLADSVYAPAGIHAVALLGSGTGPDGSVRLWLAEATGTPGTAWSVERLGRFARDLGRAQARFVDRVPDLPWLSRDWLAQYLACRAVVAPAEVDWADPRAAVWPAPVRATLDRMWRRRDDLLVRACAGPRTLCHLDVWPMNLVDDGTGTVLLDWSFVGTGGLGEDPANLIVDAVADGFLDVGLLPRIVPAVTDGYLAGLAEGGWRGRPDDVRRTIVACGAAKYSWFGPAWMARALAAGPIGHPQYGTDASPARALARVRGLVGLLADWGASILDG